VDCPSGTGDDRGRQDTEATTQAEEAEEAGRLSAARQATGTLLRLAAFTTDPAGGNPAGVWIGDALPPDAEMQRIAAEVGYSETAFLAPDGSALPGRFRVRYFSPLAEVPFCGHATIASGVALAERALASPDGPSGLPGRLVLTTNGGPVPVMVESSDGGRILATLTSIATWVRDPDPELLAGALALLGWRPDELDPALPPAIAFAGAKHLVLAARDRERLAYLEYPFEALRALMLQADLTTIQLVWREAADRFRARDPFPVGGVVEDPATGAAAGALGAYLRHRGEISPPASFEIIQGVEMGRPSRITVSIAPDEAGVRVSGNAVPIAPNTT
jgi:PhzF family phenazine biosynthesis protein